MSMCCTRRILYSKCETLNNLREHKTSLCAQHSSAHKLISSNSIYVCARTVNDSTDRQKDRPSSGRDRVGDGETQLSLAVT